MSRRWLLGLFLFGAVGVLGYAAFAWRPAIAPIEPPTASSFAPELVAKGKVLAEAGNCASCHTSENGARFSGSHVFHTPFGTLHSTNITPDAETGIGRWSEAAFMRAMREGVARDGSHLFPAFPFDHFTKLTDADIKALYAYLMTLPAVKAPPVSNDLMFPFGIRALQAAWKALYLDKGTFRTNPARGEEWNRGAYLVESLTHCGACHTPRNLLGAEQTGHPFAGSLVDGWVTPALDLSASPARWTKEELVTFLRGGTTVRGRAVGSMGPVVKALAALPDSDIAAIAAYFVDFNRPLNPTPEDAAAKALRAAAGKGVPMIAWKTNPRRYRGEQLYVTACGSCHDNGGSTPLATRSDLALSTALWQRSPHNFINIVLDGVGGAGDAPGPMMPPFRNALSDRDITEIADYLRRTRVGEPLWPFFVQAMQVMRNDPRSWPVLR